MIHPAVRLVDVDPEGFAAICAALAARDRAARREVTLVHRSGAVRTVVHSAHGRLPGFREPVRDATAVAARLLSEADADLATVIDEDGVAEISAQLTELGRTCRSQGELLWRARELWQRHPAVVTDPPPHPARWPVIANLIAAIPDGHWLAIEAEADDGGVTFRLAGEVRGGLLVLVTSRPPIGPVAVRLVGSRSSFDAVLRAAQPYDALVEAIGAGRLTVHEDPGAPSIVAGLNVPGGSS